MYLKVTCVAAPVQIEATVDGHEYYYRARHGRYRIERDGEIVDSGDLIDDCSVRVGIELMAPHLAIELMLEYNTWMDAKEEKYRPDEFGPFGNLFRKVLGGM